MTDDQEEILSNLLSAWHWWQLDGGRVGRSFNSRSLVVGDYHVSRQYDDVSGTLDAVIDADIARTVDFHVSEMEQPWKTAIYVSARNLCTGLDVWWSPRLPFGRAARIIVVAQARAMLSERLMVAGLL